MKTITKSEIQEKIQENFKDNITLLSDIEFATKRDRLKFNCKIHGEFESYFPHIIKTKCGCPRCGMMLGVKKSHEIIKEKYGSKGPLGNADCRKKGAQSKLEKHGDKNYNNREQAAQTCIDKYGVDNPWKSKEVRKKIKETLKQRYGVTHAYNIPSVREKNSKVLYSDETKEKIKQTNLERYGDTNVFGKNSIIRKQFEDRLYQETGCKSFLSLQSVQEKSKETCLKRYGAPRYSQSLEGRARLSEIGKDKNVIARRNQTMKERGCYTNPESERKLKEVFKENNILFEYNYISDKYPFKCDFYLPDFDLYIELNFHWTHGPHAFDENNEEDQRLLAAWKSKNTPYYNVAVQVWSIRDVLKLQTAKDNNLNYLVFYNQQEVDAWLNDFLK